MSKRDFFNKLGDTFWMIFGIAGAGIFIYLIARALIAVIAYIFYAGIDTFLGYVLLYGVSSGIIPFLMGYGILSAKEFLLPLTINSKILNVIAEIIALLGAILLIVSLVLIIVLFFVMILGGFLGNEELLILIMNIIVGVVQTILFGEESVTLTNAINRFRLLSIASFIAWWIGVISGVLQIYEFFRERQKS
jgi:hypothetical protein